MTRSLKLLIGGGIYGVTTGRCSDCHMNVKPSSGFPGYDHTGLSATSGTQDCNSCHSWPGTGAPSSPNWLGASAAPTVVTLTGFSTTATDISFMNPARFLPPGHALDTLPLSDSSATERS